MKKIQTAFLVIIIILITSCKDQDEQIEQKNKPIASFTVSSDTAMVGDTIYFYSTCQHATDLVWDFGDGNGSIEENPFHSYSKEGNYEVQLIASNEDGSNITSKNISIEIPYPCWTELTDLLTPMTAHVAVILNDKMYVAGGMGATNNAFEAYDFSTKTWEVKADIPTDAEYSAGCTLNGKIYVIGGWMHQTYDLMQEYDPATDSWTTKSPMPSKRSGHAAFPVNGKIYVIGGCLDWPVEEFYNTIEIYNPATDSWSTLTHEGLTLTGRWGHGASMVNDKIYIIGGTDALYGNANIPALDVVQEYDPAENTWTTKTPMPTARWGLVAVTVNNKIYTIGGANEYKPTEFTSVVEEYDPVADTWAEIGTMPKDLLVPAAVVLNNIVYIAGGSGFDGGDIYNCFYSYDPACDTE